MFGFGQRRASHGPDVRGIFAALDVGSSTITCLLCHSHGGDDVRVLGMGVRRADGIRAGNVVDAVQAQKSILNAINQAEEIAGETAERVILASHAGRPHSRLLELEIDVDNSIVNRSHLQSLDIYARQPLAAEQANASTPAKRLHTLAINYALDQRDGIVNPIGMTAHKLVAKYVAVTSQATAVQTLVDCIERCHLQVTDIVAGPLASGYGALNEEERQQGATLIDFGAECTSIAAFHAGQPVHLEVFPIGSDSLTSDLSAALGCSINHAERVKCLYGAAFLRPTDGMIDVSVPSIDPNDAPTRINRAFLVDVIQARLDELFDLITKRLDHPKLLPFSAKRVVLTGGGAAMVGIKDYAALRLGRATRLGRPAALPGLSHMRLSASHSAAVGVAGFVSQFQNANQKSNHAKAHAPTAGTAPAKPGDKWQKFLNAFTLDDPT